MRQFFGHFLIFAGIFFIVAADINLFRFKNFYSRLLISSQIDTVGFLTVMAGMILRSGLTFFGAKILLICVLSLIISPLNTHSIARSAYKSGYRFEKEDRNAP